MPDLYFLLGENVTFSPSPYMMNAAFTALGIDAEYRAISAQTPDLISAFTKIRTSGARGLNVTIPHKTSIMRLLDSVDRASARIGAVNTIKLEQKMYKGYNTDVDGIIAPLKSRGLSKVNQGMVLGTGGAARAFCEAMHEMECSQLTAVSRNPKSAANFLQSMRGSFPEASIEVASYDGIPPEAPEVFFNASPAGGSGVPLPPQVAGVLKKRPIVFDAVYYPVDTALIRLAEKQRCAVIHGHEMLLHQGLKSFLIWTGLLPPEETMREALLSSLGVMAN